MIAFKFGEKVRLVSNPDRIGVVLDDGGDPEPGKVLIQFLDGDEAFVRLTSLETVPREIESPTRQIQSGQYRKAKNLRDAITSHRLSGRLANLIYSLNTTNTHFLAYQFKPVVQFLESANRGILIADEVGLGKTIEAGLIWTELVARQDARRLLIICPAMLREKWKRELDSKFGVQARIAESAQDLLDHLEEARRQSNGRFALIGSIQGLRPPRGWDSYDESSMNSAARLARFLNEASVDEPLLHLTIVDEAHYVRNRDTSAYELVKLLRGNSDSLVLLSATPIQLKSADLFTLLNLLDEDSFPYESSLDYAIRSNAPLVALRDMLIKGLATRDVFISNIKEALQKNLFRSNEQLEFLLANAPTNQDLSQPPTRALRADQIDRINPLTKMVCRSTKRDFSDRPEREALIFRCPMNESESLFYSHVTNVIRDYCERFDQTVGFMVTIPQRQMSSCMAAAYASWLVREDGASEDEIDQLREEYGDYFVDALTPLRFRQAGDLVAELVAVAHSLDDASDLRVNDSKYSELRRRLKAYWSLYPNKKVVLFSFYRMTLEYLKSRLEADGIASLVLHGGSEKEQAIKNFESSESLKILLASEVASEGVDLQFCSLVVNYDLPWNPAKVEQRIGRIDRIGQSEKKILIWNFVYADTVDERVCDRLYQRLNLFKRALGSVEQILGKEASDLANILLTHNLTKEEEEAKIDSLAIALERLAQEEEKLEDQANNLIAHGDFVQNKIKAANELGRFITNGDLLHYVRDNLYKDYEGIRFLEVATNNQLHDGLVYDLELTPQFQIDFLSFVNLWQAGAKTRLTHGLKHRVMFHNVTGASKSVERITQDHPLVRFVATQNKRYGRLQQHSGVVASSIDSLEIAAPKGIYVFFVERWNFSGAREIERLEYEACHLDSHLFLSPDESERVVNRAAVSGVDWVGARADVDVSNVLSAHAKCEASMQKRFELFRDLQIREDRDRVQLIVQQLNHYLDQRRKAASELISRYRWSGKARLIPMTEGRLKKEEAKITERISLLMARADSLGFEQRCVASGLIRIT
jgi:SNF2 family DNA or RNA helicase